MLCFQTFFTVAGGSDVVLRRVPGDGGRDDGWGTHLVHSLPDEPGVHVLGEYLRDDRWGAYLIHPLPDELGVHVLGEYLGEMTGGELISFILYQMNLGFMFSVSTW